LYLFEPLLEIFEAVPSCHVVDEYDALGSAVVGGGEGAEAFLSGGVPDGEFDFFVGHVEVFDFEVDADCGLDVIVEGVVGEAEEHGGLSYSCISNHEYFK